MNILECNAKELEKQRGKADAFWRDRPGFICHT